MVSTVSHPFSWSQRRLRLSEWWHLCHAADQQPVLGWNGVPGHESGLLDLDLRGLYGGTNASCSANVTPATCGPWPSSSLVSWWKGDDTATDLVGGNNGTLENGAGFGLGEVGDAFSLNGNNQCVRLATPCPPTCKSRTPSRCRCGFIPLRIPPRMGLPAAAQPHSARPTSVPLPVWARNFVPSRFAYASLRSNMRRASRRVGSSGGIGSELVAMRRKGSNSAQFSRS